MLILHRVQPGGQHYYLRAAGHGEVPGEWIMGAERPGLGDTNPVTAAQLQRALPSGTARVAAFDATFAAPKSVSVLHGVGAPAVRAEVEAAHDQAVRAGLAFIERHACAVRTGGAVAPASGLVVAGFRHRVSRALDPHLHTHALVANRAPAPDDGRPLALHSPLLYGSRRAAGAVYQAVLRRRLTLSLGLTWAVPIGGRADAQVVPSRVRSAFSIRGRQVLAAAGGELGERGWAARVTRPPRDGLVDIEELRAQWAGRVEALGWVVPELHPPTVEAVGWAVPSDHSAAWGRAPIPSSDRWTRADVMVAIADRCRSGATLEELETACDQVVGDHRVITLGIGGWHAAPRYTTEAAVERRRRIIPTRTVDGRPEALDWLRRSRQGGLLLVTPDAAGAAALAARTGAAASAVATAATATLMAEDLVVLMRPERMESAALEQALRGCRAVVVAGTVGPREIAVGTVGPREIPAAPNAPDRGIPVRGADITGGTITVVGDARSAADLAVHSWLEAKRQGRPALLVALPDEVDVMNHRAHDALVRGGLRASVEVGGWAAGDLAWFDSARPSLGIERHTIADVQAVTDDHITLAVAGRSVTVALDRMATVRPARAVPPVPSLLTGCRELFVVGGWLPPGGRGRGPVHRHITAMAPEIALDRAMGVDRSYVRNR